MVSHCYTLLYIPAKIARFLLTCSHGGGIRAAAVAATKNSAAIAVPLEVRGRRVFWWIGESGPIRVWHPHVDKQTHAGIGVLSVN